MTYKPCSLLVQTPMKTRCKDTGRSEDLWGKPMNAIGLYSCHIWNSHANKSVKEYSFWISIGDIDWSSDWNQCIGPRRYWKRDRGQKLTDVGYYWTVFAPRTDWFARGIFLTFYLTSWRELRAPWHIVIDQKSTTIMANTEHSYVYTDKMKVDWFAIILSSNFPFQAPIQSHKIDSNVQVK